jgi:DnaK suppressor protein
MPTKAASKKSTTAAKRSGTTSKASAKTAAKAPKKAAAKTAAKAKSKAAAKAPRKTAAKAPGKSTSKTARKAPAKKTTRKRSTQRSAFSEFRNFEPYKPKRGEEYMNDAQLAHFRDILLKWKSQLMEEVDRTVTHMKDEAANFPDPADRATQEEEFSLELRTRDRERKLIKKIDVTLERVDQDDYGFCDACGVEIGIKRLEARPTATLCIDCKTLDEIKERQELG